MHQRPSSAIVRPPATLASARLRAHQPARALIVSAPFPPLSPTASSLSRSVLLRFAPFFLYYCTYYFGEYNGACVFTIAALHGGGLGAGWNWGRVPRHAQPLASRPCTDGVIGPDAVPDEGMESSGKLMRAPALNGMSCAHRHRTASPPSQRARPPGHRIARGTLYLY